MQRDTSQKMVMYHKQREVIRQKREMQQLTPAQRYYRTHKEEIKKRNKQWDQRNRSKRKLYRQRHKKKLSL